MQRWLMFLVILGGSSVLAHSQDRITSIFVAPGGITHQGTKRLYQAGGAVQLPLGTRFGVGAELSALLPGERTRQDWHGLASLNGYAPLRSAGTAIPFVTAGYSLLFRQFTANLVNFGGGVDYWYNDDRAIRVEIRDHIGWPQSQGRTHYWGIRLGIAFR